MPPSPVPSEQSSPTSSSSSPFPLVSKLHLDINVEDFLKSALGSFSLTYFADGKLTTIGNLLPANTLPGIESLLTHHQHSLRNPPSIDPHSLEISRVVNDSLSQDSAIDLRSPENVSTPASRELADETPASYANTTLVPELDESNIDTRLLEESEEKPDLQIFRKRALQNRMTRSQGKEFIIGIFQQWDAPMTDEVMQKIDELRLLIWGLSNPHLKHLVTELTSILYPVRRKLYPYKHGEPFPGWPAGIRYMDPAHLSVRERIAVAIWLYLDPVHQMSKVIQAQEKVMRKFRTNANHTLLVEIAVEIRHMLWQN